MKTHTEANLPPTPPQKNPFKRVSCCCGCSWRELHGRSCHRSPCDGRAALFLIDRKPFQAARLRVALLKPCQVSSVHSGHRAEPLIHRLRANQPQLSFADFSSPSLAVPLSSLLLCWRPKSKDVNTKGLLFPASGAPARHYAGVLNLRFKCRVTFQSGCLMRGLSCSPVASCRKTLRTEGNLAQSPFMLVLWWTS